VGKDQLVTHRIVVYSKPGCHLCENALALLEELRTEFSLDVEEIDIEREPGLLRKYFDQVPVLIIDQRTTLAAPIREKEIRAALI
jgi:glutaredoxin